MKYIYNNKIKMLLNEYGYDKNEWIKRAHAFEHTIFPSCTRRIILQKKYGYGYMVTPTLIGTMKIFIPFICKLKKYEHAKAYYISMTAFVKMLNTIEYPLPEEKELLKLCEGIQNNIEQFIEQGFKYN